MQPAAAGITVRHCRGSVDVALRRGADFSSTQETFAEGVECYQRRALGAGWAYACVMTAAKAVLLKRDVVRRRVVEVHP